LSRRSPVVHVVVAGEIGGAERMLVDLAARGQADGRPHSIALFTPNPALRKLFRDEGLDVDDRGPVREGPLRYLASTLGRSDVRWLSDVLARRRARIVHLHTFASQVLGTRAARRYAARVVRTEHSTRVYDDPSCWPFSRWSLRRADAVICISEHVREVAIRRAPFLIGRRNDVAVVHNGVDTSRFVPRPPDTRRTKDDPVRFLALGRLDPRKGLDLALAALARVPQARLSIVGDGSARASLEQQAAQLGLGPRVRFAGHAGDVREAIANADVALSSSKQEGLGIALLEAMAMERPVVAVPIGGLPEVVRDGETGWLATSRETGALARAMQAAVDAPDERSLRGKRARQRVLEVFSIEAMRAGYERIYADVE
jgi:glycosyltransferase involved in cell wall biosynthesis